MCHVSEEGIDVVVILCVVCMNNLVGYILCLYLGQKYCFTIKSKIA